jgi:uncharacterized protein (TIGR03083 family)
MFPMPSPPGRIDALPALRATEARLLELLAGLSNADWEQPTSVPGWRVRHVAGHLLDTALRRLTLARDGVAVDQPASFAAEDVRAFVDRANAEGVQVLGRLSPAVLRSLMRPASAALCRYLDSRDPEAPAVFPVSWAGETSSPHWFDVARELTERWHHQQQIRLALGRPGLMTRDLYQPVLDCFARAWPYAYRDVTATPGTHVAVEITGEAGGVWTIVRGPDGWRLTRERLPRPSAVVTVPGDIAWRIFTKGIRPEEARRLSHVEGDAALAQTVFSTKAIVG